MTHGLLPTHKYKNVIYTEKQTPKQSHTHSYCSTISTLPHCPVSQDDFFCRDPQQAASISWMGKAHRLVKHKWLIYWNSGPKVGGILDVPGRPHCEIIQQEQRACSGNNRGEIPLSCVQMTTSLFFFLRFVSCEKCSLPGELVFFFCYTLIYLLKYRKHNPACHRSGVERHPFYLQPHNLYE